MEPEKITSLDIRRLKFLDNIKVDLDHIWGGLDCNNLYRNSEKRGAFVTMTTKFRI
jgi:hypothetical protein